MIKSLESRGLSSNCDIYPSFQRGKQHHGHFFLQSPTPSQHCLPAHCVLFEPRKDGERQIVSE